MIKHILKKIIALSVTCVVFAMSAQAQERVTVRDLNTYAYELTTLDSLSEHPKVGETVSFTAIISSYPKNSGLASYNSSANSIGRVHIFVIDTTAASDGRDGMSMQIVQGSDTESFGAVENLLPGSIIDVTGFLTFFGNTAQFTTESTEDVTSKVAGELGGEDNLARFDPLLLPREVNVSELNARNEEGQNTINLANYSKYVNEYVILNNSTVQFSQSGSRPNMAFKNNGEENLIYNRDISLRFRNDKSEYRTLDDAADYNFRRAEDGEFTPPPAGALVTVSGYLVLNDFDPFSTTDGNDIFNLAPMDDGVLWVDETRNVNGENGFVWRNDLTIIGFPPTFENITLSVEDPTPDDVVTLSIDILPATEGATIQSTSFKYAVNGADTTDGTLVNSEANTYTFTFPQFADGSVISYQVNATDSEGLDGTYDGSFLVANFITSIETVQKTADEGPGDSPLAGLGALKFDLTATVVSDAGDGMIIIHQSNNPWSGVFVDADSDSDPALVRGDVINITEASVEEDFGITYLTDVTFTKTGTDENYADLIPQLVTQDIRGNSEAYEGMMADFLNARVLTAQADGDRDFGEFEIGSAQDGADTLEVGEGLRIDGSFPGFGSGNTNFNDAYNENVKVGTVFDSVTGAVYYSFSNPKLLIRQTEDLDADDWTFPIRTFSLVAPGEAESVNLDDLTSNIEVTWTPTTDQDGNSVLYVFTLSTTASADGIIFEARTDDAELSLTVDAVDALLAENQIDLGGTANLFWTVGADDGVDTVYSSTFDDRSADVNGGFTVNWREISFTRLTTSNENAQVAYDFALEQNYPNPFNPTTTIKYSIPAAADVELTVFNVLGQKVATLVNQAQNAGSYTVNFDATALSSGIYFYRLNNGAQVSTKKMMLIK